MLVFLLTTSDGWLLSSVQFHFHDHLANKKENSFSEGLISIIFWTRLPWRKNHASNRAGRGNQKIFTFGNAEWNVKMIQRPKD